MTINFARLRKDEIVWMACHKCKAHNNRYIEHPACYLKENPDKEHAGFIDIESSNLNADWGICLCVSILDLHSDELYTRIITKEEVFHKTLDKELLKDVLKEMRKFDRLIGYYASNMRFDIPFLRTRAVHHNIDNFPGFGEIVMEDLYPIVKYKFKLSSNRLENACEALLGSSNKTKWLWKYWLKAIQGDQKALDYITDHCRRDTEETKKLYRKIFKYNRKQNTSL